LLAIKSTDTINFMVHANVEQQLKALPNSPGVYLLKDVDGSVIYVGKATNLKKRTKNHFNTSSNLTLKTRHLMLETSNLDYIVTGSAQQALILECNLIKKFSPRYNVRLKDDKTFPYLIININEDWPGVYVTRRRTKGGARYFGPFASAGSVRKTLKLIEKIFPFRSCSKYIDGTSKRPCLDYYIHNCLGPCIGAISKDDYQKMIEQVILFLEGRQELVLQGLFQKLINVTEKLEFEKAASIRDQIQAVRRVIEGQKIAIELNGEQDVIAFAQNMERAYVEIFFIRNDKLVGHDHFIMEGICDDNPNEIITGFIKQYYSNASYIPTTLLLQHHVTEKPVLVDWLRQCKGDKVQIQVPRRGAKKQLVNMVARNAGNGLLLSKANQPKQEQIQLGLQELQNRLNLPKIPTRIECYDISNIQGMYAVGSMVVLENGLPEPSQYRRFRIKTTTGPNDYAMIQEVLKRRLVRGVQPDTGYLVDKCKTRVGDMENNSQYILPETGWTRLPSLILIDGGKGQLSAALEIIRELEVSIPLASLAKENEDVFIPDRSSPIDIAKDSSAIYILQSARDEAHRFAINYHRKLRKKQGTNSILEDIPGIGPKRKKALLKKFGSVQAMKLASVEEIGQIDCMNLTLAKKLKEYW